MKIRTYITLFACTFALWSCANGEKSVDFTADTENLDLGPEGGKRKIKIASEDNWVAMANEPWITVSPANGKGSVTCELLIDSALTNNPRSGIVRLQNLITWEEKEITINQKGFDYAIRLKDAEIEVENFAAYGKRYFEVKVNTNVDFDIEVPTEAESWLKPEKPKVVFDRGIRPRDITVRFNWGINSRPEERPATVKFIPKSSVTLIAQDELAVTQKAAEEIPENSRKGDSIALLAIGRTLDVWQQWDSGEKMDNWSGVQLWNERMPGYKPENKGRVRYARFYIFNTKEGVPFEVQYLTAAEELVFFSNANNFLYSLNTGEYICELKQLKRLSISSFGLTELHTNFTNLTNLESLDLSGNNFQKVPEVLTKTNFPKLKTLHMSANQRKTIYDLSNNTVLTDFGGLYDETEFPVRLLEWELDTLTLSVNYLQGAIPTLDDYPVKYTQADIDNTDSLKNVPQLIGKAKIMTNTKAFTINLNRLTGKIPDWLLYHPMLNYWDPQTLVFFQEGKDELGASAGFTNTPPNMNYYYDAYTTKKRPNAGVDETL